MSKLVHDLAGRLFLILLVGAPLLAAIHLGLTQAARALPNWLGTWAATQGVRLQVDGDPRWSWLPTPNLTLGHSRVGVADSAPAFGFEASALQLRWQPWLGAQLHIADPVLSGINLEQGFCALVATATGVAPIAQWLPESQLDAISGRVHLERDKLLLDALTTAAGNVQLSATGTLDLGTRHFEVRARIRLVGERTSPTGCRVTDVRLRDRDLPLRCVGNLGTQPQGWCVPEGDWVAVLAPTPKINDLPHERQISTTRPSSEDRTDHSPDTSTHGN